MKNKLFLLLFFSLYALCYKGTSQVIAQKSTAQKIILHWQSYKDSILSLPKTLSIRHTLAEFLAMKANCKIVLCSYDAEGLNHLTTAFFNNANDLSFTIVEDSHNLFNKRISYNKVTLQELVNNCAGKNIYQSNNPKNEYNHQSIIIIWVDDIIIASYYGLGFVELDNDNPTFANLALFFLNQ